MQVFLAFILLQVNILFPPDSLINSSGKEYKDYKREENKRRVCKPGDVVVTQVKFIGNTKTRNSVLARELLFSQGDTLHNEMLKELFEKSQNNLMNTGLFHSADISIIEEGDGQISALVLVNERWYLWPFPILELADRNFNSWWLTKDLSHVNFGMYLVKLNFRGNKETILLRFKWGFTRLAGITYNIPYINSNQKLGLGFFANYSLNKQVILTTRNNKIEFFNDMGRYVRSELTGGMMVNYRSGFYTFHSLGVKYTNVNIHDTIKRANPNYLGYDVNTLQYVTMEYSLKSDKRDYKPYPLKGSYCDLVLSHHNFPFKKNNNLNVTTATVSLRKYNKLGDRWSASGIIKGKVSAGGFQPFYVQRGLGYQGDYVRGYEYYAFDGQHFLLAKSSLKYNLVKPGKYNIGFLGTKGFNTFRYAFYLGAFLDGGYVWDRQFDRYNPLSNQSQLGGGIGLDFLTSNDLVIRFEYSVNKFAEHTLYLHAGAPF